MEVYERWSLSEVWLHRCWFNYCTWRFLLYSQTTLNENRKQPNWQNSKFWQNGWSPTRGWLHMFHERKLLLFLLIEIAGIWCCCNYLVVWSACRQTADGGRGLLFFLPGQKVLQMLAGLRHRATNHVMGERESSWGTQWMVNVECKSGFQLTIESVFVFAELKKNPATCYNQSEASMLFFNQSDAKPKPMWLGLREFSRA